MKLQVAQVCETGRCARIWQGSGGRILEHSEAGFGSTDIRVVLRVCNAIRNEERTSRRAAMRSLELVNHTVEYDTVIESHLEQRN